MNNTAINPAEPTDPLEEEIKSLIVEVLALADVKSEDISSTDPLFGEGLGLDSIDALELAMGLSRRYGVELSEDDGRNRQIFASVRSLAAYVRANRSQAAPGAA
jgi:acyl carrier protein